MIRKATEKDLEAIMDIVSRVVAEMESEGIDQWSAAYPARRDFAADIARGELYVDDETGSDRPPAAKIRGVVCVNREEPPEYRDGAWSRDGASLVIHRLAVHPECRRRGVGRGLLLLAEELARAEGIAYLRSDTYSMNARMNALFARMAYRRAGDIRFLGHRQAFHCYDKELGA